VDPSSIWISTKNTGDACADRLIATTVPHSTHAEAITAGGSAAADARSG